jgi:hypothetical protein
MIKSYLIISIKFTAAAQNVSLQLQYTMLVFELSFPGLFEA